MTVNLTSVQLASLISLISSVRSNIHRPWESLPLILFFLKMKKKKMWVFDHFRQEKGLWSTRSRSRSKTQMGDSQLYPLGTLHEGTIPVQTEAKLKNKKIKIKMGWGQNMSFFFFFFLNNWPPTSHVILKSVLVSCDGQNQNTD